LASVTLMAASAAPPEFRAHTIATDLRGGYQVVPVDVNHDGKIDLIALASGMTDLVWFENPTWERHVIASNLPRMINLAAWDIDGDGIPEIVLAHEFSMRAKDSLGIVSVLKHNGDPRHLWQLWDAFGIEKADMIGWWVHDTPVKTGNPDVLATSYMRKGDKTLVSIASWAPATTQVKLTINWKALGLNPAHARLVAPAVEGFQPAATFKPGDAIPVEPGKGWLLELEPAH